MSLQIFDSNSNTLLDTTDRLSRLHARYQVVAPYDVQSGFVSVPGMVDDGTWYCFCNLANGWGGGANPIVMQIANGGFNWMRWGSSDNLNTPVTVMRI